MSYYLYDANGFVSGGPSIHGWERLRHVLRGPYGSQFAERGFTEAPRALAAELERRRAPDEDTQKSLENLRQAALKADDILILTSGIDVEEDVQ